MQLSEFHDIVLVDSLALLGTGACPYKMTAKSVFHIRSISDLSLRKRRNSSALAMELLLLCIKPSI